MRSSDMKIFKNSLIPMVLASAAAVFLFSVSYGDDARGASGSKKSGTAGFGDLAGIASGEYTTKPARASVKASAQIPAQAPAQTAEAAASAAPVSGSEQAASQAVDTRQDITGKETPEPLADSSGSGQAVPGEVKGLSQEELIQKYKDLKSDRDNVINQAQKLLQFKRESVVTLQEAEKVKKDKEELEKEAKALADKKSELEASLAVLSGDAAELKSKNEELEKLADQNKAKETIKKMQEDQKAQIAAARNQFRGEIEKLQKEIKAVKAENAQVSSKLEAKNKELAKKMGAIENEKKKIADENKKADDQIAKLKKEAAEMKLKNKNIDRKNDNLSDDLSKVPVKYKELAKDNNALTQEVSDMHYNLGVFYCNKQDFKRAAIEFRQVLEARPTDKDALFNLGLIYAEHRVDQAKALEYFRKYLRIDNNSSNAEWAKKYIMRWEMWRKQSTDILHS